MLLSALVIAAAILVPLLVVGTRSGHSARASSSSTASPTASSAATGSSGTPGSSAVTAVSWNPAVHCVPVVTTLEAVIGRQLSSYGGASQAGGWQGGLSIPVKTALTPPCTVNGAPMFVEIHNLNVEGYTCNSFTTGDGDCWGNLWDNSSGPMTYLNQIHSEIAGTWITAKTAPSVPPTKSQIDVQGFVYWDSGHLTDAWHSYSGWELHPVAAWRADGTPAKPDFSMSLSPSAGSAAAGHAMSATISTEVISGGSQLVNLTVIGLPAGATARFSPTPLMTGGSSILSITTSARTPPGSYLVRLIAAATGVRHVLDYALTVLRRK